ncbi:hypothetical protein N658DRAFT_18183 [Parathielavia hyrcaniae]|uniref:Uncharacterized protein n=1 Tax=Parathielavia hyrcaniae TaxID=113614 RepID=A0AAN6T708_9PEZI|nr:hypothetical protein N658DRAFT_18183 [Parathielavia hyrcaniae]
MAPVKVLLNRWLRPFGFLPAKTKSLALSDNESMSSRYPRGGMQSAIKAWEIKKSKVSRCELVAVPKARRDLQRGLGDRRLLVPRWHALSRGVSRAICPSRGRVRLGGFGLGEHIAGSVCRRECTASMIPGERGRSEVDQSRPAAEWPSVKRRLGQSSGWCNECSDGSKMTSGTLHREEKESGTKE